MKKIFVLVIVLSWIISCKKQKVNIENCKILGIATTKNQFANVYSGSNQDKESMNYFIFDKEDNLIKIDTRNYEKEANNSIHFVFKNNQISYSYFGDNVANGKMMFSYNSKNQIEKISPEAFPNQKIEFLYNPDNTLKEIKQTNFNGMQWVNVQLEYDKNKNPIKELFRVWPSVSNDLSVKKFDTKENELAKYAIQIIFHKLVIEDYDEMSGIAISSVAKNYIQLTDLSFFENEYASTGRIVSRYSYIGAKKDLNNLVAKRSFLHDCK